MARLVKQAMLQRIFGRKEPGELYEPETPS